MERVHIEKMVFGGQSLGRLKNGQAAFIWNALPGEEAEIDITKKKLGYVEGIARAIITPAKERIEPKEPDSYLATSPWQIMTPEAELKYKKEIAAETYQKLGNLGVQSDDLQIATDGNMYGYRNKMEFGFTENQPYKSKSEISLAFFTRGGKKKIAVAGSELAHPAINEAAQHILQWINEQKIPMRSLKSLIVRSAGETALAALFLKDTLVFEHYPELTDTLRGVHIFYSTHQSPASVPTELLYTTGQDTLTEMIMNTQLTYGLFSFFQINPPVFELTLADSKKFIKSNTPILDFYAGVGTIGLSAIGNEQLAILVEENAEAVAFAKKNIELNQKVNCEAICAPAERMLDAITYDRTLLVDPPRAGLHPKLIERIRDQKPRHIVYLSCGVDTQARDIQLLSEAYQVSFLKLYNFFPRTPHIEALAVLER